MNLSILDNERKSIVKSACFCWMYIKSRVCTVVFKCAVIIVYEQDSSVYVLDENVVLTVS